ncbi:DNA/RNA polymerase [Ascodesmis nigricans]|uniref:DNA-directed RNA polymerase n=1 Tax=Ascodesmis nigricans TaxID=341454 RepID=A0A4S2N6C3_9PEZI|nr:DNA/RNA polymerase [Ascodesmis nigricans]
MLRAASRRATRPTTVTTIARPSHPAALDSSLLLPFLYPPTCTETLYSIGYIVPNARRNYVTSPQVPSFSNNRFQLLNGEWIGGRDSAHRPPTAAPLRKRLSEPSLLILEHPKPQTELTERQTLTRRRHGISKSSDELLATYEACIRVGRVARAQLMLNEITRLLSDHTGLLVNAHNSFLRALLKRAQAEKSEDNVRALFSWYEDTMVRKFGISPDATTMALLFSASLQMSAHLVGERHIKRWAAEWEERGHKVTEIIEIDALPAEEAIRVARILKVDPSQLSGYLREKFNELSPVQKAPITEIPEANPSVVKGLSLASVRQSLRSLIDPDAMPSPHAYPDDDASFQVARQKLLEDDAYTSAQEVWKKDHESLAQMGLAQLSGNVNALLWEWHQTMVPLIMQELDRVALAEEDTTAVAAADRLQYGPFLRLMPPEKIAATTILEIVKLQNSAKTGEGIKSSSAVLQVGNILEQEYYAQEISKKKHRDLIGNMDRAELQELFSNARKFRMNFRKSQKIAQEKNQQEANADMMFSWPAAVKAKLGAVLISMLIHGAKTPVTKLGKNNQKVTQMHPAIYHNYEYIKGRRIGILKLHPELIRKLAQEPLRRGVFGRLLPMLVPPRPWLAHDQGAYYYTKSRMMRTKYSKEQELYVQAASERGDLEQVFEGLDVLGQTAWKINRRVFDVVLDVWNKGEEFADIPGRDLVIDLPHEPPPGCDFRERAKWIMEMREAKIDMQNNHSQRCSVNLKLEIARAFLFERFYFPHSVDFRGRAYPIPPNLNHIGDDLSRGLLMFDKGKELGERGLWWLKIHLANIAGNDKASFSERVKFVEDHYDEVFDSADNPLTGRRWWLKAEDPWQCLASCFALSEALRMEDPTKYVCHFPVAQDGTCNGLQHYAALGGDEMGARQVNLEPSDRPQDVYTGVADLVNKQVNQDAAEGHEIAKIVQGHILRKVVKQSVMTNVYGVTFIGARQQIQNQLEDNPAIPKEIVTKCASYIAKLVFQSISSMFGGATGIQHWLANSARIISRSAGPSQVLLREEDQILAQTPLAMKREIEAKALKNAEKAQKEARNETQDEDSMAEKEAEEETLKIKEALKNKKISAEERADYKERLKQIKQEQRDRAKAAKAAEREAAKAAKELEKSRKGKKSKEDEGPKIEFMSSVIWTTPLGMPIVQPYRTEKSKSVQTNLQKIQISDPSAVDQVNSRKQMTAFPPNFIHSLDATHMLLSATKCAENGLTFASVHDSFWTHPSDVDTLNEILREAFIKIHATDIMTQLKKEFETRYAGYRYLVRLNSNREVLQQIRDLRAQYASDILGKKGRRITLYDEFMWEMKRDELIRSEDPEDRARGEAMITPSVLVEKLGGVEKLEDEKEAAEALGPGLGDTSSTSENGAESGGVSKRKKSSMEESVFDADDGADPDSLILDEADLAESDEGMDPVEKDLNTEEEIEALESKIEEMDGEDEPEVKKLEKKVATKTKKYTNAEYVWMPLTFPELPPKGKFDVKKLKASQYFFS